MDECEQQWVSLKDEELRSWLAAVMAGAGQAGKLEMLQCYNCAETGAGMDGGLVTNPGQTSLATANHQS